jgi:hypothetical protein
LSAINTPRPVFVRFSGRTGRLPDDLQGWFQLPKGGPVAKLGN